MARLTRAFENPYSDYDDTVKYYNNITKRLVKKCEHQIKSLITDQLLWKLEMDMESHLDWKDQTVYSGTAGIAMMYMHLANIFDQQDYLDKAALLLQNPDQSYNSRKISFLSGVSGTRAVSIVLNHKRNMFESAEPQVKLLEEIGNKVLLDPDLPDELMTGRAGYLYSLLFVNRSVPVSEILIRNVVKVILKSGQNLAKKEWSPNTLVYKLHGNYYLGVLHGVSGILSTLLLAREYMSFDDLNHLVKPAIDCVLGLKLPSGNFPAYVGNDTDRLVQWCHGAPGILYLFSQAYAIYGEQRYLEAAVECGEVIWERGLLKKGYGLCHGVAGNAYAFLRLFKITNDDKYLHRALKFSEWISDYGKHGCREADHPLSLYEGLAGTIHFLASLVVTGNSAVFPGFDLPSHGSY
ncbi:LANCL1 [Cordylochernes scorpioides]|uniref:LANCL1 n=1 Tax=Cordylochernes scorpioides TaxID=51811 RepID=A0ABY6K8R1_9ARAC|nr:LANCL1 [Cordylochernes scorpioides]